MTISTDIRSVWTRIEQVLEQQVPETARTLAPPATDQEIAQLEEVLGLALPEDFIESLRVHNGQNDSSRCHTFIIEGLLASAAQIAETWRMLTELDDGFRQRETNWDTHGHGEWWNRKWVPFTIGDGDCLCINLNPQASIGEILCHVHDSCHEPGIAVSYAAWLQELAQRLENGEFTVNEYGYLDLNIP